MTEHLTLTHASENEELARALSRRDPEVLDLLIERYQFRLLRYLTALTRDAHAAEDLFQETWIRILERGGQYNGKSRFETWLFAIARNLVIDRIRRNRSPVSLDEILEEDAGKRSSTIASETGGTVDELVRQEQRTHLQTALAELPAGYREALVLRFLEELTLEEVSSVVNAPLSTVKSRIYRGLDLLREKWEKSVL